jgi:transposase
MKRRKYDTEFKKEAARLVLKEGRTISSVEDSLGITHGILKDWVRLYREHTETAFVGSGNLLPEDEKVRLLEKELARVTRERDILKKAVAIFSKEPETNSGS